jgi:hypothetical protein
MAVTGAPVSASPRVAAGGQAYTALAQTSVPSYQPQVMSFPSNTAPRYSNIAPRQ